MTLRALLAGVKTMPRALPGWWLLAAAACASDAVGIDACRRIEIARCRAAEPCGQIDDVPACERFYRDQCLHGLAVAVPAERIVEGCVLAIQEAGECARSGTASEACTNACSIVETPERSPACSFLGEVEPPSNGGGAGTGGGSAGSDPNGESGAAGEDGEPAGSGAGGEASG